MENELVDAAGKGFLEVVRSLVEDGVATMKAHNFWRRLSHIEVARFLLEEYGAHVHVKNNAGHTVIRVSDDHGYNGIRRLLKSLVFPARVPPVGNTKRTDEPKRLPLHGSANSTIPPAEVMLSEFCENGDTGGDFHAKWLDADAIVKLFVPGASDWSFEQEVRMWQELRHPNVLKLYGACYAGPQLQLFVCEHASKGSLAEYIDASSSSSMGKPLMWTYLYQAALSLKYIHERGIVHDDLRCRNILIGSDGIAKLSHFGWVDSQKISSLKERVGSMWWQSPEVVKGGPPSFESDVYSMGMCILEAETEVTRWGGATWKRDLKLCGFVLGRTIHEAIDIFEAAKAACKKIHALTDAQVLLLDFAKAYDSVDRRFLMAVLRAKGFPDKFCKIVEAIHDNTTVRFLANGELFREVQVTSGIRQGCPLAPFLFIIVVDLLYDDIENDKLITGIVLGNSGHRRTIKVAGYADDTAIYVASRIMQRAAIAAVGRFSRVWGLMPNVHKSSAIRLGPSGSQDDAGNANSVDIADAVQLVAETESTRYLGHWAGTGDTTEEAWVHAFKALTIRLALAVENTNSVQQRATIAAAIIVPKLLYVARHAWPNKDIIVQADQRIRNYVWKSTFSQPDRVPPGWVKSELAEQSAKKGGIGIPNIASELVAMSASTVAAWATSEVPLVHLTGEILQQRGGEKGDHLTPLTKVPSGKPQSNLWGTGRLWARWAMSRVVTLNTKAEATTKVLRQQLRARNGLKLRWHKDGLEVQCVELAKGIMNELKNKRRKETVHTVWHGWTGFECYDYGTTVDSGGPGEVLRVLHLDQHRPELRICFKYGG